MRTVAIPWAVAIACGASGNTTVTATTNVKDGMTSGAPPCRTAYVDYEAKWRLARTEELEEFTVGHPTVLEEILHDELATLPSRTEVTKLRDIYAVVEAFLWDAPWPRALAAAQLAIEQCGERTPRPSA